MDSTETDDAGLVSNAAPNPEAERSHLNIVGHENAEAERLRANSGSHPGAQDSTAGPFMGLPPTGIHDPWIEFSGVDLAEVNRPRAAARDPEPPVSPVNHNVQASINSTGGASTIDFRHPLEEDPNGNRVGARPEAGLSEDRLAGSTGAINTEGIALSLAAPSPAPAVAKKRSGFKWLLSGDELLLLTYFCQLFAFLQVSTFFVHFSLFF
jgi:hypothetical protein